MEVLWMVRAGEGGRVADDFRQQQVVALNCEGEHLTNAVGREQLRPIVERAYADRKRGFLPVALGSWHMFRSVMKIGDNVMTYDPARRMYHLGKITGDYEFRPGLVSGHEQIRRVEWQGEISRDELSKSARNTLGSTLAIFEPGNGVLQELRQKLKGATTATPKDLVSPPSPIAPSSEAEQIRRDVIGRSHEFRLRSWTGRKCRS
ncbi:MAG: hypothetical protein M3R07_12065 [Gemmatimonadota bacterium]|nr:hypothetical protein [Gemmatimonadota bacterium]